MKNHGKIMEVRFRIFVGTLIYAPCQPPPPPPPPPPPHTHTHTHTTSVLNTFQAFSECFTKN